MKKIVGASSAIAVLLTALASSVGYAATFEYTLDFETQNQSIWGTGSPLKITDSRFLGFDWDEDYSKSINIPFSSRDVGIEANTSGQIGFQSDLNISGGSVSANVPIDIAFTTPDTAFSPGDTITLDTHFTFNDTANFTTQGPKANYNLDLIGELNAFLNVGSIGGAPEIDFNFEDSLTLINLGEVAFDTGNNSWASLIVASPQVNTTGQKVLNSSDQLHSSGSDSFARTSLDLDSFLTGGSGLLEGKQDIGIADVSYNLLNVEAIADVALVQTFGLTGQLPALLSINGSPSTSFLLGDSVDIIVPSHADNTLEVEATIDFGALFENNTELDLDFMVDLLVGEFGISAGWIDIDETLFEQSFPLGDTSISLFSQVFDLDGFETQQINFSLPLATTKTTIPQSKETPMSVPEPGVLFGLMVLGTLGFIKKRPIGLRLQSV